MRGLVPASVGRAPYVGAVSGESETRFGRVCDAVSWFGRVSGGWGWDERIGSLVGTLVAHVDDVCGSESDAFHLAVGLLGSPMLAGRFSDDAAVKEAREERDARVLRLALAGAGVDVTSERGSEDVETVLSWVPSLFTRSALPWATTWRCLERLLGQSAAWHARPLDADERGGRRRVANGALHVAFAVIAELGGPVQAASALDPDAFVEAIERAETRFEAVLVDRVVVENQRGPAGGRGVDARLLADELEAVKLKGGVLARALHAAEAQAVDLETKLAAAEERARVGAEYRRRVEAAEKGARLLAESLQRSEEERGMLHSAVYRLQRELSRVRGPRGDVDDEGEGEGGVLDPWLTPPPAAPSVTEGGDPTSPRPAPAGEETAARQTTAQVTAQVSSRKKGNRRSGWRRSSAR